MIFFQKNKVWSDHFFGLNNMRQKFRILKDKIIAIYTIAVNEKSFFFKLFFLFQVSFKVFFSKSFILISFRNFNVFPLLFNFLNINFRIFWAVLCNFFFLEKHKGRLWLNWKNWLENISKLMLLIFTFYSRLNSSNFFNLIVFFFQDRRLNGFNNFLRNFLLDNLIILFFNLAFKIIFIKFFLELLKF